MAQQDLSKNPDFQEQGLPLFDYVQEAIQTETLPSLPQPNPVVAASPEETAEATPLQGTFFTEPSQKERINSFLDPGLRQKQSLEKEFETLFKELCYTRDRRQVFSDFAELAAIWQYTALYDHRREFGVDIFPKDKSYDAMVKLGKEVSRKYSEDEISKLSKMTVAVIYGSNMGGADFLGELYNKLELIGQSECQARGEFFTPYTLGRLMAQMTITRKIVEPAIKEKGCITFDEPACGAGGLLIAAAERLEDLGYDPRTQMFFVATDVSRLCFNMTYIQMSALGIPGVVKHGNTLSLECWETRPTPSLLYASKVAEGEITGEYIDYLKTQRKISIMNSIIRGDELRETASEMSSGNGSKSEDKKAAINRGFGVKKEQSNSAHKESKEEKRKKASTTKSKSKIPDLSKVQLNIFDITLEQPEETNEM